LEEIIARILLREFCYIQNFWIKLCKLYLITISFLSQYRYWSNLQH